MPVVASVASTMAVGIGSKKESCDRAAALALTIASALKQDQPACMESLLQKAAAAPVLNPMPNLLRFNFGLAGKHGLSHHNFHVVWHLTTTTYQGCSFDGKSEAEQMFDKLRNGPYAYGIA